MSRTILGASVFWASLLSVVQSSAQRVAVELPIARPLATAFSPDGQQVAVGGLEHVGNAPIDGLVFLIDAHSGQRLATLRHSGTIKNRHGRSASQNMVHEIDYSPDGRTLAVAADLGLKLWNSTDGSELATLFGYGIRAPAPLSNAVESVKFSPDGKLLATGKLGRIELWDVQARKVVREMEPGGKAHISFSNDGSLLASAEGHNRVRLWDVASGKQFGEVHAEMGPLYGVAIHPDGTLLAAVGEGGAKVWRIRRQAADTWTFADEMRLSGHFAAVRQVAFSPDGRLLATRSDDGTLKLYDSDTQQEVAGLWSGGPFSFSPDGRSLAVAVEHVGWARPARESRRLTIWRTEHVLAADRLAEQARSAATELVQALASERRDRPVIVKAMATLSGPSAGSAAPILIEALEMPDLHEKNILVMVLGRMPGAEREVVPALIKALRSRRETDVRTAAAVALTEVPIDAGKIAVPALIEAALNDESPHVRSAARRALGRLDPAAYRQAADEARAHGPIKAEVVRRDGQPFYQGRSLEEWLQRLSVSFIPNEIFGRPRPDEPLSAIRAFGADAVPVLIETLNSDQRAMRQAAIAGLEAIGSQAQPAVEPLLNLIAGAKPDDLTIPGSAADALAAILNVAEEPPDTLMELLQSDNLAVRITAARAIAQLQPDHEQAVGILHEAADGRYPDELTAVRYHSAAGEALRRLGLPVPQRRLQPQPQHLQRPTGAPTIESLTDLLADPNAPSHARVFAAGMLQRMGEEALPALPVLLEAVGQEEDRGVSRHLEMAIQRLGPQAVPAVRNAVKDASSDETRRRLIAALTGMGAEGREALDELLRTDPALGRAMTDAKTAKEEAPVDSSKEQAAASDPKSAQRQQSIATTPRFNVHLQSKDVEIRGWVDTLTNTFTIASWTDTGGCGWTPHADRLPLVLVAYMEDGTPFDVPKDWDGQLAGFAFLLPANQDLRDVHWNEGTPDAIWKGASFGWGGLRNSAGKVMLAERRRFRYVPNDLGTSDLGFKTVTVTPVSRKAD